MDGNDLPTTGSRAGDVENLALWQSAIGRMHGGDGGFIVFLRTAGEEVSYTVTSLEGNSGKLKK